MISVHGNLNPIALKSARLKKQIALGLFEKTYLENASCLHALNEKEYRHIRDFGLKNPVCIIPNGVNLPNNKLKKKIDWRQKETIKNKKILLYLSRIHPGKGLELLIDSWNKVKDLGAKHNWHLVIVGWGNDSYVKEIKNRVRVNNLNDHISFVGAYFGEDKAACYAQSDAFILPSFHEGLPTVVLEAWSYKLPVLMTTACNLPEGFEHNAAISLDLNEDSFCQKLEKLFLLKKEERTEMGLNGYGLVVDYFNWDFVANRFLSVYSWILNKAKKPDCVLTD